MRILVAHNVYLHRGGEDSVVEAEIGLLRSRGHEVATYLRHNDEVGSMPSVAAAGQALWSSHTMHDLTKQIHKFQPSIIQAHNTFPLISPALYWAAERAGVPVVQTLHNFRLMCLNALFLREGRVCEDCLGHMPWRGVVHKCYRGSYAASAVLAGMLTLQWGLRTYRDRVARYIALTNFSRNKFIEGGLPATRIEVKPNFVDLPAPEVLPRHGLLFVGRLSVEKGVVTLAKAAALLPDAQLRVVGGGPETRVLDGMGGVTRLGSQPGDAVLREMRSAIALVMPSICYENFPRTLVEAFACGLPVIASRIGALAELVQDGETGLLFEPGDPRDLADKMAWALVHRERMASMGTNALAQYTTKFSADVNYRRLMQIYAGVLAERENT